MTWGVLFLSNFRNLPLTNLTTDGNQVSQRRCRPSQRMKYIICQNNYVYTICPHEVSDFENGNDEH